MLRARTLAALCSLLALTIPAPTFAQTSAPPAGPADTAIARVYHPTPPLPSYDVATIKPFVPVTVSIPNGMSRVSGGITLRQYIRNAYGPGTQLSAAQVIGGPDWLDKDQYDIQGKPSPDLEVALKKMTGDERNAQTRAMQQSLLADRFHLKVHFEVREMPVYALVPAKGGLKIKAVDAPPVRDPNGPAPQPLSFSALNQAKTMPPGVTMLSVKPGVSQTMRAGAVQMSMLVRTVSQQPETGGRPVLDQTGFTGYFNIDDLTWALTSGPLAAATDASSADTSAPSLETALEETLGIKLVATKGRVEVVVIDSIDHPSEN